MATEDFDRSFEFFADPKNNDSFAIHNNQSNPNSPTRTSKASEETSFDSRAFAFSVTKQEPVQPHLQQERQQPQDTDDLFSPPLSDTAPSITSADNNIQIIIQERLSAMYDDFSQEGAVTVTGSVHVALPTTNQQTQQQPPYRLVLQDNAHRIHRVQEQKDVCKRRANANGQRVFEIQSDEPSTDPTLVLHYFCVPKLKPVPLLIKSRVNVGNGMARVGFKIRANPHNPYVLSNLIVLLAIPPDVDGEMCKISHKGGTWEEMKRTISWCLEDLNPGQALEIQAQFPLLETLEKAPKFPILVRCGFANQTLSGVDVDLLGSRVHKSVQVLHRKV